MIVLIKNGGDKMKKITLFLARIMSCSLFNQSVLGKETTISKQDYESMKQKFNKSLGGEQFGCTCAGLKACMVGACALEFFGIGCASSGGRGDAICMCLDGAMSKCTNYQDILNDSGCTQQRNDYDHNNYGNCNGKKT